MNPFDPNNPFGYLDEVPGYDELAEDERTELHVKGCLYGCCSWVFVFAIAILIGFLFGSCSTQERIVTVERVVTDTVYQVKQQRDSIYFADSIYVSDFVRGDTVWSIRDRWHTRYVERIKTDTIYQSKRDTVTQVVETAVPERQKLSWWQQTRLHIANILIYTIALCLLLWVWSRRR